MSGTNTHIAYGGDVPFPPKSLCDAPAMCLPSQCQSWFPQPGLLYTTETSHHQLFGDAFGLFLANAFDASSSSSSSSPRVSSRLESSVSSSRLTTDRTHGAVRARRWMNSVSRVSVSSSVESCSCDSSFCASSTSVPAAPASSSSSSKVSSPTNFGNSKSNRLPPRLPISLNAKTSCPTFISGWFLASACSAKEIRRVTAAIARSISFRGNAVRASATPALRTMCAAVSVFSFFSVSCIFGSAPPMANPLSASKARSVAVTVSRGK
mmetsp:Transcript_13646/g.51044  ORF Transcript_13646/g.51044 Transcript_13646/m.51044 type:complete len:266 (-) Transcript_13646:360-1157(-)